MRATNKVIRIDDLIDVARMQGSAFDASVYRTGISDTNTIRTVMVNNGTKPVILYSRLVNYTGDGVVARIYRDPDIATLGDPLDIVRNPSDINPTPEVTAFYSDFTLNGNNSGQETRSPDYSFANPTGAGGGAPGQLLPTPQIMAPGQTYLFEIAGRTANVQVVAAKLSWVELEGLPGFEFDAVGNFVSYRGVSLK